MNNIIKCTFLISFCLLRPLIAQENFELNREVGFIPKFDSRYNLGVTFKPSMTKTNQVIGIDGSYSSKFSDGYWLNYEGAIFQTQFSAVTKNNASATLKTDTQLIDAKASHVYFGVGLSVHTELLVHVIPFKNIYEISSAALTYNLFKYTDGNKTFLGPGIKAKYGVHKKLNDYVSIGGNFIYNLSVVKRSEDNSNETSSARSLTLSYLSIGFDVNFYL